MRSIALSLVSTLLALAVIAAPAPTASAKGLNNAKAGLMSVGQFLADPVIHVVTPPDDFIEEFPVGQVTGRVVGLFSGTLLGIYRGVMGVTDLVFTPFWVMPVMSPEPRWWWFEDVEYE